MADIGLWAETISEDPSQGDVVADVLLGGSLSPEVYLFGASPTTDGSKPKAWSIADEWSPVKADGMGRYVARGRYTNAIVLSHCCECDKAKESPRIGIILAPLRPLAGLPVEARQAILEKRRIAFHPLVSIPKGMEDSYVDLRAMFTVVYQQVTKLKRLASMTESGKFELQAAVAGYFSRRELGESKPDSQ
jgi:hypothetical protein